MVYCCCCFFFSLFFMWSATIKSRSNLFVEASSVVLIFNYKFLRISVCVHKHVKHCDTLHEYFGKVYSDVNISRVYKFEKRVQSAVCQALLMHYNNVLEAFQVLNTLNFILFRIRSYRIYISACQNEWFDLWNISRTAYFILFLSILLQYPHSKWGSFWNPFDS